MKLKTRVKMIGNNWGIQIQFKERGRWLLYVDGGEDSPVLHEYKEEAELKAWLMEKGPRFERWFTSNYNSQDDS